MSDIRDLPIGIQSFEKLRAGNYVYVDKTQYVYNLVRTDKPYFLSRPRRFGKSLLLSTMKAYFEGKKHLFEGLAIAELEKEWTKYPVIYIDLSRGPYTSLQALHNVLNHILRIYEKKWEVESEEREYSLRFENVITAAFEKTKQKVAVLVDEYDKPLIGTMDDFNVHDDIRIALRGFYGVLKGM
ncbi:MAG: AAA family ATPase, partial [Prevotellaceae bacterium]|nr:AAA family ATPase [Prevotellaceae bacterium]